MNLVEDVRIYYFVIINRDQEGRNDARNLQTILSTNL